MAWQTPKTDWMQGDLVTPADMIRIGGNLNYLTASTSCRTNYTTDDYVFLSDWTAIKTAMQTVMTFIEQPGEIPDDSTTSYNFNLVESFCADAKPIVDLIRVQQYANKYAGEFYADNEIYAGGFE